MVNTTRCARLEGTTDKSQQRRMYTFFFSQKKTINVNEKQELSHNFHHKITRECFINKQICLLSLLCVCVFVLKYIELWNGDFWVGY